MTNQERRRVAREILAAALFEIEDTLREYSGDVDKAMVSALIEHAVATARGAWGQAAKAMVAGIVAGAFAEQERADPPH
jgi:hypothetical protein